MVETERSMVERSRRGSSHRDGMTHRVLSRCKDEANLRVARHDFTTTTTKDDSDTVKVLSYGCMLGLGPSVFPSAGSV